jgi:hypothetical protein
MRRRERMKLSMKGCVISQQIVPTELSDNLAFLIEGQHSYHSLSYGSRSGC